MSVSLRKFRAALYDYSDVGTDGEIIAAYQLNASSADDSSWWASRAQPTGREVTTGMQAEHHVEAVFGFSAYAPVTEDGAIVCDGVEYLVRAILARDYGRDEVQVYAERAKESLNLLTGSARVSQMVAEVLVGA